MDIRGKNTIFRWCIPDFVEKYIQTYINYI